VIVCFVLAFGLVRCGPPPEDEKIGELRAGDSDPVIVEQITLIQLLPRLMVELHACP
jgi:hypothetical protein